MSTVKADKSLKLTQYLSVSLCVRRPHHLLAAAVFVKEIETALNTHLMTQQCAVLLHSV